MNHIICTLARTRGELSAGHVLLCLAVGIFVAAVTSFFIARGFKKRDGQMTSKTWGQLAMYAVSGIVIGYFVMRFTIKSNMELFDPAPKVTIPQFKPYEPPELKLVVPDGMSENKRPAPTAEQLQRERELEAQAEADRIERERQAAEARAEHERRIAEAQQEREQREQERQAALAARREAERLAAEQREIEAQQRREAQEAERAAEAAAHEQDLQYLSGLSLAELQAERAKRKQDVDNATQVMREPGGTTEERAAIRKEFSRSIRALQDVNTAIVEKRRAGRSPLDSIGRDTDVQSAAWLTSTRRRGRFLTTNRFR